MSGLTFLETLTQEQITNIIKEEVQSTIAIELAVVHDQLKSLSDEYTALLKYTAEVRSLYNASKNSITANEENIKLLKEQDTRLNESFLLRLNESRQVTDEKLQREIKSRLDHEASDALITNMMQSKIQEHRDEFEKVVRNPGVYFSVSRKSEIR